MTNKKPPKLPVTLGEKLLDWFTEPAHWVQGMPYGDKNKDSIPTYLVLTEEVKPDCLCLSESLMYFNNYQINYNYANFILSKIKPKYNSIAKFNDSETTTHKDIVKLCEAIVKWEKESCKL